MCYFFILFLITIWATSSKVHGTVIQGPKESVAGGDYLYYNLSNIDTYVHLELITNLGDCDLYVSEKVKYPTFEDYTLQSVTYGIDSVLVRKKSKGPVYIGIYGHPRFENSECLLKVCLLERPESTDDFSDELTELNSMSHNIEEMCLMDSASHSSFLGRSWQAFAQIIRRIELDGFLLEFVTELADDMLL